MLVDSILPFSQRSASSLKFLAPPGAGEAFVLAALVFLEEEADDVDVKDKSFGLSVVGVCTPSALSDPLAN